MAEKQFRVVKVNAGGGCACPSCLAAGPTAAAKPVVKDSTDQSVPPEAPNMIEQIQQRAKPAPSDRMKEWLRPDDQNIDRQGVQ